MKTWFLPMLAITCCAVPSWASSRSDAGGTELAVYVSCMKRGSDPARHFVYLKGIQGLLATYLAEVERGVPDDYALLNYQSWLQQIDTWSAADVIKLCDEAYTKGLVDHPLPKNWPQPQRQK